MLSGIQRYIMSGGRLGSQTYNICRSGYFQLTNIIRTFVEYNKYYQPQKAMEEPFDYSQVPFTFGMCAAENCPQASTCLRQIALKHAPANKVFLPIMNPNHIKGIKEKCDYFCSNEKVRYAKGFMCTINALTVRVANTFRYRMIGYLGRKNYYLKRSGKLALTPAEQQWIINTAKELGVIQSEYFDSYIEEYNWDR